MNAAGPEGSDKGSAGHRPVERIEYQPALDGLRAVAVLLVLVYHDTQYPGRPGGLRGGFLGVDVFFVLSGYLITSLLLAEHASSGRVALRSFWTRRARRLLPAALVMLCIVALYAAVVAAPADLGRIRADSIATLFYVQNWHVILGDLRSGSILNHAWSLSVEEQWYLVWPVLLAAILSVKRARVSHVLAAIVSLAAASALWTFVLHAGHANVLHLYYGTDTRAQELLIGAALAVLLRSRAAGRDVRHESMEVIGLAGCVVIAAIVVMAPPKSTFFPDGGYAFFAVAVAAVIAVAVRPTSTLVRLALSIEPLRKLGLISYGMYLYHWPLYWWLTPDRTHASGAVLLLVRVAATIVVATFSYFLVERPVRRGSLTGATASIATPVAFVAVFTIVVVATREPTPPPLLPAAAITRVQRLAKSPGERVLVVGHGLVFDLQSSITADAARGLNAVATGFLECSFVPGGTAGHGIVEALPEAPECGRLLPTFGSLRDAFRPDAVVIVPDNQELYDRRVGSHLLRVGSRPWSEYATARLDDAIAALATSHRTPVVVATVRCNPFPPNGTPFEAIAHDPTRRRALNDFLRDYATARRPQVTLVDLDTVLCRGETPIRTIGGRQIIDARGELTVDGSRFVWNLVAQQVTVSSASTR